MNKFWIVFKKEYLTRVRKPSFIFITIFSPLLFVAIIALPVYLGMTQRDTSEKEVVVIDHTSKYFDIIAQDSANGFIFTQAPQQNTDIATLRNDKESNTYAYIVIREDLLLNPRALTIYSHNTIPPSLEKHLTQVLPPALRDEKIASYNIPELKKIIEDTKVNINISTVQWSETGEEKETSTTLAMIIGQIFNITIFIFVMMYGSMVMASVTEEKKSRIVEIISSSVKPTTLLGAKIAGIGCVGLTQVTIWTLLIISITLGLQVAFLNTATLNLQQLTATAQSQQIDPTFIQDMLIPLSNFNFGSILLAFIFYFICGYVSFASLYAAFGAATDSDEDVQQLAAPITIFMTFGFYLALYSAENPNGPLSVLCSFLPFVAPGVMMVRLPFNPPLWQIVLSAASMILSTILLVWISAKIFKVGLLMYGKKPKLKEIIRWIRFS